jgi:hypothetical protein
MEVLDRRVAKGQPPRLSTGHAVRAGKASIKSAFVITHVQSGGAVWQVQGGLEFGSKLSGTVWNWFIAAYFVLPGVEDFCRSDLLPRLLATEEGQDFVETFRRQLMAEREW